MSKSVKKSRPKYSPGEDAAICKALVAISTDGEVGVGKKSETYWSRIFAKFITLWDNTFTLRDQHSINNRFCIINKEVQIYLGHLKKHYRYPKSGWGEIEIVSKNFFIFVVS